MVSVIVLFPKPDNGRYIKNILMQHGIEVAAVHTSGAQAILTAESMEEGLIICGCRFKDMMYSELREYLPDSFKMLLLVPKRQIEECTCPNVVVLSMPVKAFELIRQVNALTDQLEQMRRTRKARPKARSQEDKKAIARAKELLMEQHGMAEDEAHRYLQKRSMDSGTNLVEMAKMVLDLYLGSDM